MFSSWSRGKVPPPQLLPALMMLHNSSDHLYSLPLPYTPRQGCREKVIIIIWLIISTTHSSSSSSSIFMMRKKKEEVDSHLLEPFLHIRVHFDALLCLRLRLLQTFFHCCQLYLSCQKEKKTGRNDDDNDVLTRIWWKKMITILSLCLLWHVHLWERGLSGCWRRQALSSTEKYADIRWKDYFRLCKLL